MRRQQVLQLPRLIPSRLRGLMMIMNTVIIKVKTKFLLPQLNGEIVTTAAGGGTRMTIDRSALHDRQPVESVLK